MRSTPARLHRLALELRDLRNLRDAIALLLDDPALRRRAIELRDAYAPANGGTSGVELDALLGLELTGAQVEALATIRHEPRPTARATSSGAVHHQVAQRLVEMGLARRAGYFVSITYAGRVALDRAHHHQPRPLAKTIGSETRRKAS